MPQHPLHFSIERIKEPYSLAGGQALALGGVAFNEAELTAMTAVVNDVCVEYAGWNTPEQREFIAWLVVRLSRNGVNDPAQVKAAVVDSLIPKGRLS